MKIVLGKITSDSFLGDGCKEGRRDVKGVLHAIGDLCVEVSLMVVPYPCRTIATK
jgi:hypothetical protein